MDSDRLHITTEPQDSGLRLSVAGEMNIYAALQMQQEFQNVLAKGQDLDIDLSAVNEMDTTGFQLLYQLKRETEANRHALRITRHSAATQEVLDLFGMNAYLGAVPEQTAKSASRKGKRRS